ncbi:protein eva-1 homolog A [Saccopteryx leptura]|uniref:protein eva-1 homolog A n=1 Tax=Saccopteryx leptura TaxID=249018 RepID=UPI00339C2F51
MTWGTTRAPGQGGHGRRGAFRGAGDCRKRGEASRRLGAWNQLGEKGGAARCCSSASPGLGAIARESRGWDPALRAVPWRLFHWDIFPRRQRRRKLRAPICRVLLSVTHSRSPGSACAPRSQPPEVRAGGPREEPDQPTGTNQVSGPVLLGTSVTRDELFLPEVPLLLTAHLSPEEKKGGATLIQLEYLREAPLDATWRRPFHRCTEPLTAQRLDMALLSNILAAYSFVSENPERAALYFVSGVCIGLVLTLAALVMRISCHTDCRRRPRKKFLHDQESSSDSSDSEDGSSDTASDISVRRHRRFERTLNKNVFTSAEELERAQRLEERERIIREIWMNGQPEVPGTRSLNRYY